MSCPTADSGALLTAAYDRHQTGGFEEAEALYRRLLTVDPGNAAGLHRHGLLAAQLGRLEEADRVLGRALAAAPLEADAAVNHGKVLRALGRPDAAARRFRHALALVPALAVAQEGLGHTGREQGDPVAAAAGFGRAARCGGGTAVLHLWGMALAAAGRPAEAIAALRAFIRREPTAASPALLLGDLLLQLGSGAEAAACFRRTLILRPDGEEVRRRLAAVPESAGNVDCG